MKRQTKQVGSVIHCTLVCVLTYEELCSRDWTLLGFYHGLRGKFDLGSANTPTGVAAVIYCTGYMVADQIFMYIWCPWEILFILHHWATLLYMGTVLMWGTGDLSCCLCIFLGEVTNPINNCMQISDILVSERLIAPIVNRASATALCVAFFFIRLLYAPVGVCYLITKFYLMEAAAASINLPLRLLWSILPIAVTFVSIDFLRGLAGDVYKNTTTSLAKEQAKAAAAAKPARDAAKKKAK